MDNDIEKLRKLYMENPPEGMTALEIKNMSEDDLLDMEYFLNEDVFGEELFEEGFYIF